MSTTLSFPRNKPDKTTDACLHLEQQLVQETSKPLLKRGHKRCSNHLPGMKAPAPALGEFGSWGSVCAVITQHSLQTPPQVRLQSAGWMLERWVSPDACRTDSSAPHSKARSDRNSGCEVIPLRTGKFRLGKEIIIKGWKS